MKGKLQSVYRLPNLLVNGLLLLLFLVLTGQLTGIDQLVHECNHVRDLNIEETDYLAAHMMTTLWKIL